MSNDDDLAEANNEARCVLAVQRVPWTRHLQTCYHCSSSVAAWREE